MSYHFLVIRMWLPFSCMCLSCLHRFPFNCRRYNSSEPRRFVNLCRIPIKPIQRPYSAFNNHQFYATGAPNSRARDIRTRSCLLILVRTSLFTSATAWSYSTWNGFHLTFNVLRVSNSVSRLLQTFRWHAMLFSSLRYLLCWTPCHPAI
jgi:hypothetical protein